MKWTDADLAPAERRPRGPVAALVETLKQHPGRWAEVGRYPAERRTSAYSRGNGAAKRYTADRLEYAVTRDGSELVLLYRVAP